MTFKAPFRSGGFFDPTTDNLSNCDMEFQAADYARDGLQLSPGCMVTIAAFLLPETDTFITDFVTPQREVALHLRAKVSESQLTLNSTIAGKWQAEMRVKNLPLRKGRAFHMSVLVTSKAYLIAYNDEHFAAFPHRMPYEAVNTVAVTKGLKFTAVYYEVDYKYSKFRFTVDPIDGGHLAGSCSSDQRLLGRSAGRSAVYPQLPYHMSLADSAGGGGGDGGGGGGGGAPPASFFGAGACLLMTLKPNFTSKCLTISLGRPDSKAAMELELYVNHSQGRVQLHAANGGSADFPLWSLIGLNRRRHTDVCLCCTESALRLFIGHRPVFQAGKEQLQSLWGRATELSVKGDADLIVAHFCRL